MGFDLVLRRPIESTRLIGSYARNLNAIVLMMSVTMNFPACGSVTERIESCGSRQKELYRYLF